MKGSRQHKRFCFTCVRVCAPKFFFYEESLATSSTFYYSILHQQALSLLRLLVLSKPLQPYEHYWVCYQMSSKRASLPCMISYLIIEVVRRKLCAELLMSQMLMWQVLHYTYFAKCIIPPVVPSAVKLSKQDSFTRYH